MNYVTAEKYANWEWTCEPFKNSDGKLCVEVKQKCDRCSNGVFVCRVENGKPIPHPAYGGVCLKCNGAGYLKKVVRVYTEKEREQMDKRNEKAREKREADREAKMRAEFAHRKAIWLQTNGFSEDGKTYIVTGDSYSIKDQLKEAGFRFNGTLRRWMRATNEGYEENTVLFSVDDLVQFSAWGEGHINLDAKEFVDKTLATNEPVPAFEYDGEIKERITRRVTLVRKGSFMGAYGITNIYTYEDEQHLHQYVWFTATDQPQEVDGSFFTLVGTVKDHKEYKGIHQTYITRCKITEGGSNPLPAY